MTGSMEDPLLEDGTPALALLNRTGVGGPTLRLPAAHGWAQIRPGLRLGNNLVAVDRAHGRVAVPMEHDRGHRPPRAVERGLQAARPAAWRRVRTGGPGPR